jgi:hypothetical protein
MMKIININDATKIFIIAATTIITCVIVAIGMSQLNIARDLNNTALSQMSSLHNDLKNSDIKMYDDAEVTGSQIVNFIKKQLGDYTAPEIGPIYVYVKTNQAEHTYVDGTFINRIRNFTETNYYIKPTAKFISSIYKNDNNVILGVNFIQK